MRSASCSERLALGVLLLALASPASAKRLLDRDEALRLAFGANARIERQASFLTDEQVRRARALAGDGVRIESALVTRYLGTRDGGLLGTAYFDTHRVRTLPETVMIVVAPDGAVSRAEVLAFGEPEDYLPRPAWLEHLRGRRLDRELALRRGVHGITGATLSARAMTEAMRRVLAVHQVLR